MSNSNGEAFPVIEKPENLEDHLGEMLSDIDLYFKQLSDEEEEQRKEREARKVVPIRPEVAAPQHTDTELVPETLTDVLFGKLVFDPHASLVAAQHEAWLLDDLLPAKGMAFIYGPPGSYKSFMAVDFSMAIATGRPWHGYECEQPGAVLYIAAEGARGVMERQVGWLKHHEVESAKIVTLPVAVMFDEVLMVQAFTECAQRAALELGEPIRMVVIDTMARSFGGDENSAQEVGAFVNACMRFAEDIGDCLVLVVAHTGKDITRGMRGSSALDGAADCHFMVTRPNDGQALLRNTKQKDVEKADDMRFAMHPVSTGIPDRKGRIRKTLVPILESRGELADPDNDDVVDAFMGKDLTALVGFVRMAKTAGEKITEDELRQKFVGFCQSEGKKGDTIRKAWERSLKKAKDQGRIIKDLGYYYPGDKL